MKDTDWKHDKKGRSIVFLIKTVAIMLISIVAFKLWKFDLSAPFCYLRGDDLCHGMYISRAMHGLINVWEDNKAGYPFGAESYAFPLIPWVAVIWGWFSGLVTDNYAVGYNGFLFLDYYLSIMCFQSLAKRLHINEIISFLGGILYAFSYYLLNKSGCGHVSSMTMFIIPLVTMITLTAFGSATMQLNTKEVIVYSILLSICDPFYAFFECFILLIGSVYAVIKGRKDSFIIAFISMFTIGLSSVIILLPHLIYSLINRTDTASRVAYSAYYFALQLITLFLPANKSHFMYFLTQRYMDGGLQSAIIFYIGIFGIIGLLYAVIKGIRKKTGIERQILLALGSIVLVGIPGGIGTAVAVFITPQVRVYHRIFVYIYCLVILSFCLFIQGFIEKKNITNSKILIAASGIAILFHLYDMGYINAKTFTMETYNAVSASIYHSDSYFSQKIKEIYPGEVKILYIPYYDFPEGFTPSGLGNYSAGNFLRIFNDDIITNYGTIYGTNEAAVMAAQYDTNDARRILAFAVSDGYDAIIVDKNALEEDCSLCKDISEMLKSAPIAENKDYQLYNISSENKLDFQNVYENGIAFISGFETQESNEKNTWRWADKDSAIKIISNGQTKGKLCFDISSYGKDISLHIEGAGISEDIGVSPSASHVELEFDLSKGDTIKFSSSEESTYVGRNLNFAFMNWEVR